jgi:hypothetical protein
LTYVNARLRQAGITGAGGGMLTAMRPAHPRRNSASGRAARLSNRRQGSFDTMSLGELLFQMTEWIRTTQIVEFSLWVSDWPLALWLQGTFVAIPGFQTIHILAIAILFGSSLMLNLRVLGINGNDQSLAHAFARYRPWMWLGLLALVASGIILLISEPVRNMVNPIFWIKMATLIVTVLVTLWYQNAIRARLDDWDLSPGGQGTVRAGAAALIILWLAVMAGGRWIAYAPV